MSILYVESCGDHYGTGDAGIIWADVPASFSLVTGRGGFGKAIRIPTGVAGSFKKTTGADSGFEDTYILGMAFRASAFSASATEFLSLMEGGMEQVHFRVNNDGTIEAYRGGGTSNVLGVTTNALSAASWYFIEVMVKVHGSTGTVDIQVSDGSSTTSWLSLTGKNTSATGNNLINGFAIVGDASGGSGPDFDFDDIYVMSTNPAGANTFLGDYRVEYVAVNGAGSHTGGGTVVGAASEHAAVADQPFDGDATYVPFAADGDYSMYTFAGLSNSPIAIAAVFAFAVARKDAAGPGGVRAGLGSPPYLGTLLLNADYEQVGVPDEGPYTPTTLAALQVGVQRVDS